MPEPISEASAPEFFIGVDGGGSRCRVRIRDRSRVVIGTAETGAANVSLNFDGSIEAIVDGVVAAFGAAGLDRSIFSRSAIGLGLAGVSSPAVGDRVRAALPDFARAVVGHDGLAACLGAHEGRDGGLVIAGTGSAAVLWMGRRATSLGGRGFLLGDDGSGAWIGRAALRLALRAYDDLEPTTPLLDGILAAFDRDVTRVIAWGKTAPSHAFAAYAPRVFEAARDNDAAGLRIISAAAGSISELIEALAGRGAPRISLVGGMASAILPYLPERSRVRLSPALADALEGALLLAGLPLTA